VLTVLLAYSRGGVVIAVIVAAAWLGLDRRRLESLLALVLGGGVALAVAGIALALPGITADGQPHSVRVHDGRLFLLVVVTASAVVAFAGRALFRLEPDAVVRRRATAVLFVAIALTCIAGVAAAALHSTGSTNASVAGEHCTQGARRLACGSSDARLDWWKQAWRLFAQKPFEGSGAGSFELAHRLRRADYVRPATEPHDFALQMLGETGIVGFLLFASAVGFAVLAVRRRVRDDAAVALAACALAYLVHILIDVGYDFVAVSAPFFTLLGVLLVDGKVPVGRREPVWAFGSLLLGAAAALSLAAPYIAQRKVDEAVAARDPSLAAQAHSWNPVSILPLLTQAALEEGLGHELKALQFYRQAVDTQPDNPDAWVQLGEFELDVRKDACGAYRSLSEAYTLDRYNPAVSQDGGPLDVARARARRAGCG
jgi:tetratricopeptide (TPR) repeat protein